MCALAGGGRRGRSRWRLPRVELGYISCKTVLGSQRAVEQVPYLVLPQVVKVNLIANPLEEGMSKGHQNGELLWVFLLQHLKHLGQAVGDVRRVWWVTREDLAQLRNIRRELDHPESADWRLVDLKRAAVPGVHRPNDMEVSVHLHARCVNGGLKVPFPMFDVC